MDVKKILKEATDNGASDIFIVAGRPLTYKSKGVMECLNEIRMIPKETFEFVTSIYALAERDISKFEETGDDDFSFAIPGVSRYRVSTFKQRGSYSAVIRVISFTLPKPSDLHIPDSVMELGETNKGMMLVTGPAGGGRSTTCTLYPSDGADEYRGCNVVDVRHCEQRNERGTVKNER